MTNKFIPLSIPQISGNEWKYVKECLDSNWVSSVGPFVDRFEGAVADFVGASHAVAVTNGTAALHTALLIVGVKPGEEVLVSNLTFVAPVNAIHYAGAHPILIDADPKTWQIDVLKIEQFLKEECEQRREGCFNKMTGRRVAAIVPVHILGLSCEIDKIVEMARQFGLKVVEDAAEGMGVRYKGRHIGTFGDAAALSFNGNKIITTGGGGMVITGNKQYVDYARYLTTQAKDDPVEYVHNEVGYNYRLTNVQAAIGLAQLEQLDAFVAKKRTAAAYYSEAFKNVENITTMKALPNCEATYWLFTLLLPPTVSLQRRKNFLQQLNEQGIGARPLWHTIHDLPPYRGVQAYRIEHSVRIYERGVCLPSSVGLNQMDLQKVVAAFQKNLDILHS